MKFQPVIKWTGSKRSQSEEIIKRFPKSIETYYEPFIGGGSVLFQLLHSDVSVENYICSDINEDLINLWNMIKNNPSYLCEKYKEIGIDFLFSPSKTKLFACSALKPTSALYVPTEVVSSGEICMNAEMKFSRFGTIFSPEYSYFPSPTRLTAGKVFGKISYSTSTTERLPVKI